MAQSNDTMQPDERNMAGTDQARPHERDDGRAREAFENPLQTAAKPGKRPDAMGIGWTMPVAGVAIALVVLFLFVILL